MDDGKRKTKSSTRFPVAVFVGRRRRAVEEPIDSGSRQRRPTGTLCVESNMTRAAISESSLFPFAAVVAEFWLGIGNR